jgi:hypothetical protein
MNQLAKALVRLAPTAQYVIRGDQIEWHSTDVLQPTPEQIEAEFAAIEAEKYREARAAEYPSIGDQLDALFHAGVFPADMAARLQAVKDKYPKGGAL